MRLVERASARVRRAIQPRNVVMVCGLRVAIPREAKNWGRVRKFGWWELETDLFYRAVLRPGDSVLDVGANEGILSVVAGKLVGSRGLVIACEPDPEPRGVLEQAVRLNRLSNIEVHAVALDSATTTGDEIVAGRPLRLVKIDVDGPEPEILQGLGSTLAKRPYLVIELSSQEQAKTVLGLARELGYSTYASRMKFARVLPVAAVEDLGGLPVRFEWSEVANLFCTPQPIEDPTRVWPPQLVPPAYERHYLSNSPFPDPDSFWKAYTRELDSAVESWRATEGTGSSLSSRARRS